jgi:Zn-dependent protease with chaperone function
VNFYQHQADARSRSARLYALFGVALTAIIATIYIATIFALRLGVPTSGFTFFEPGILFIVLCFVAATVVLGGWLKHSELKAGGAAVAEMVGGRPVATNTTDPAERRLLNVVDEMSIAAGVPVPRVYLLPDESGINAFAAGYSPGDAAVAVTRGALRAFNREELQAVVAHEFAHITNGDMRINIRLISTIAGISVIGATGGAIMRNMFRGAGRSRSRSSRNGGGGLMVIFAVALALWLIGYIGVFFAKLIQRAASRQREFLADASAVQFTRNGVAMANALKKIGGYKFGSDVDSPDAAQMSHLFFGSIRSFSALLSTHPPLDERIRRIEPGFDGKIAPFEPAANDDSPAFADLGVAQLTQAAATGLDHSSTVAATDREHPHGDDALAAAASLIDHIPQSLLDARMEPASAIAVVYCLLLDHRPDIRARQATQLAQTTHAAIGEAMRSHAADVMALPPALRLPLAELLFSGLRALSTAQVEQFIRELDGLRSADGRIDVFEFALMRCVRSWMLEATGHRRRRSVQFTSFHGVAGDFAVILGAVARAGSRSEADANEAFARGRVVLRAAEAARLSLPSVDATTFAALDVAIDRVASASPFLRRSLIDAVVAAAFADQRINATEADLVRVLALALETPIPDSVRGAIVRVGAAT